MNVAERLRRAKATIRMALLVAREEYRYRGRWRKDRETYKKLAELKNIHKGKRCFIVATGPSLRTEDLDKLRNEITFGVNSCIGTYAHTSWRPTYYGVSDPDVYNSLKDDIEKSVRETMLFNSKIPLDRNRGYAFLLNIASHLYRESDEHKRHPKLFPWARFSGNIERCVYSGQTVVYAMLQIAVYMGFREIYLLGCDGGYVPGKEHSPLTKYEMKNPKKIELQKVATEAMTKSYLVAKKAAQRRGITIYNATRGGVLEVFPRVNFDDLIF